jgi:hypothetical protein
MINQKIVFILGAGASYPYYFPTGSELRKEIISNFADKFKNEPEFIAAREQININTINSFITDFRESSINSIDLFLSRNRKYERIGKMAIAITILEHEKRSSFNELSRDGDWYNYLFQKITQNILNSADWKDVNKNILTFITFNYDRSLEYYLQNSMYHSFEELRSEPQKYDYIKFPVYHVYGSLGDLSEVEYGSTRIISEYAIEKYTEKLRTIYQDREAIDINILNSITSADHIVFLGFSYLVENLQALHTTKWNGSGLMSGTILGLSDMENGIRSQQLPQNLRHFNFNRTNCLEMIKTIF